MSEKVLSNRSHRSDCEPIIFLFTTAIRQRVVRSLDRPKLSRKPSVTSNARGEASGTCSALFAARFTKGLFVGY